MGAAARRAGRARRPERPSRAAAAEHAQRQLRRPRRRGAAAEGAGDRGLDRLGVPRGPGVAVAGAVRHGGAAGDRQGGGAAERRPVHDRGGDRPRRRGADRAAGAFSRGLGSADRIANVKSLRRTSARLEPRLNVRTPSPRSCRMPAAAAAPSRPAPTRRRRRPAATARRQAVLERRLGLTRQHAGATAAPSARPRPAASSRPATRFSVPPKPTAIFDGSVSRKFGMHRPQADAQAAQAQRRARRSSAACTAMICQGMSSIRLLKSTRNSAPTRQPGRREGELAPEQPLALERQQAQDPELPPSRLEHRVDEPARVGADAGTTSPAGSAG